MSNYQNLIQTIIDQKKQLASSNSNLSLWNKWYKGKVPSFHSYYIYNGATKTKMERLSMKMAKQVCEDWASLLMNEKVKIGVASQDLLDKVLLNINFYNKANKSVECGFALSMSALCVELNNLELLSKIDEVNNVEYTEVAIGKETSVNVNVYSANKIVPITFENNEIVECAFIQENTNDTQIRVHQFNEKREYNIICINLSDKGEIKQQYVIETKSKKPFFAIVHPQLVNNLDIDSPYPISIFANAIDTLKAIDLKYDSYANEFLLGRKRIFVSSKLDKVDANTGNVVKYFDPNDVVIHQLPETMSMNGDNKPLIHSVSESLRSAEHSQAIQDELNFLSKQVGLGVDYYRFEKGRVMTATQVISEKSDTFRNLKKHEGVYEKALDTIIKSLMYAYNEFTLNGEKFKDIDQVEIVFDDSVIEDKETEKKNDQSDVALGVMSKVDYRAKWYGESEEEATKQVSKISGDSDLAQRLATFTPFLQSGAITFLDFVKKVYIDVTNPSEQEELAQRLESMVKSSGQAFSDMDLANIYNPTGE